YGSRVSRQGGDFRWRGGCGGCHEIGGLGLALRFNAFLGVLRDHLERAIAEGGCAGRWCATAVSAVGAYLLALLRVLSRTADTAVAHQLSAAQRASETIPDLPMGQTFIRMAPSPFRKLMLVTTGPKLPSARNER